MATDTYIAELSAESNTAVSKAQPSAPPNASRTYASAVYGSVADACTCAVVMLVSFLLQLLRDGQFQSPIHKMLLFSAAAGLCAGLLLHRDVAQSSWSNDGALQDTANTVRTILLALFLLIPGSILLRSDFPRAAATVALLVMPVALTLQRHWLDALQKRHDNQVDPSIITPTCDISPPFEELMLVAKEAGARIPYSPDGCWENARQESDRKTDIFSLGNREPVSSPPCYSHCKRILDLTVSSICLVLLLPVFLVIAVIIRLSSKGPALFIQERVGISGRLFRMYKFRSMSCSAEKYEHSPATSDDPRITTIGRFLRRTSLDELPQLLNVFLGHMSLVGPRPEMPFIVDAYNSHQRLRLQVIPGITGLWQLSKDRAYPIHENIHHDLSYIRQRSLSLDVAILIHTLLFAMRGGI